jgi:hypothetical protein
MSLTAIGAVSSSSRGSRSKTAGLAGGAMAGTIGGNETINTLLTSITSSASSRSRDRVIAFRASNTSRRGVTDQSGVIDSLEASRAISALRETSNTPGALKAFIASGSTIESRVVASSAINAGLVQTRTGSVIGEVNRVNTLLARRT